MLKLSLFEGLQKRNILCLAL